MFAFKVICVLLAPALLVCNLAQPSNHAPNDFALLASGLSGLYFLTAGVLLVGGLFQLARHSRRPAIWNIAFGTFALIAGIVFVCVSEPNVDHEILRSAA